MDLKNIVILFFVIMFAVSFGVVMAEKKLELLKKESEQERREKELFDILYAQNNPPQTT